MKLKDRIKSAVLTIERAVLSRVSWRELVSEYYNRKEASGGGSSLPQYKRQTLMLREKNIDDWRLAVLSATDPDDPRRGLLFRLYQNLLIDEHLQTTIDNRVLPVQQAEFNLVDKNDKPNEEVKELLNRPWFHDLIKICFMGKMQGVSLAQFGELDANMEISGVEEIPMSNYIPQKRIILKEESDNTGWSYAEGALEPYYMQFGNPWALGMLHELTIILMAKKLGLGSWMNYIEKFGVPPVFVITDRMDKKRSDELFAMMQEFRNNFFSILQGNERVEYGKEAGGNTTNAFLPLEERCDKQISKRLLGQTGTTENQAYDGTAKVHERVEKTRHESDKMLFGFYFNYFIIPKLVKISPVYKPLENLKLKWDDTETLSITEYIDSIQKLAYTFDFDPKEVAQRTGLPIVGQKQLAAGMQEGGTPTPLKPEQTKKAQAGNDAAAAFLPVMEAAEYDFDNIIGRVMKKVYNGKVKTGDIDTGLFRETYKRLNDKAAAGWGEEDYYQPETAEHTSKIRQNLYKFSGAKTYQEVKAMNEALKDENGKRRSFKDFKAEVDKINVTYNANYLRTEYETADICGRRAADWASFAADADIMPNLKYCTAGDERVREAHRLLDGVVKPLTDPFWLTHYPPNGWNCRCYVLQTDEDATERTPAVTVPQAFQTNVGETGEVFTVFHQYFQMDDEALQRIRRETERDKLFSPYRKDTESNVQISDFADPKDLQQNIESARVMSKQLKLKVKIRPHINEDGVKNPEYLINEEFGDLKNIQSTGGIQNGLKSSRKQQCRYTVFNLDALEGFTPEAIQNKLKSVIKARPHYKDMEMVFVKGEKAVRLTWDDVQTGKSIDLLKSLTEK